VELEKKETISSPPGKKEEHALTQGKESKNVRKKRYTSGRKRKTSQGAARAREKRIEPSARRKGRPQSLLRYGVVNRMRGGPTEGLPQRR